MIVLCIVLPGVVAWWHGARWEGRLGRGKERNVVYDHAVYLSDFSYIYLYIYIYFPSWLGGKIICKNSSPA